MDRAKKYSLKLEGNMVGEIESLKKDKYFNTSYATLLRDLIEKGIEASKKGNK